MEATTMFRVNLWTGELCLSMSAFHLPGPLPIAFLYHYRSMSQYRSPLGLGWSHPYEIRLERDGASLVLLEAGDELHRFVKAGMAVESADAKEYAVTSKVPLEWTITAKLKALTYHFRDVRGKIRIRSVEDKYGNELKFEHDLDGHLVAMTDASGRRLELGYAGSLLREVILARHGSREIRRPLLHCGHDAHGNLAWTKDHSGSERKFAYSESRLVSYSNPLGGVYSAKYDASGRCFHTWEQTGPVSRRISYDAVRRVTRVEDSTGHSTLYRFEESGALAEKVDSLHGVTNYVNTEEGLLAVIDATGQPTALYRADDEGRRLARVDAAGGTVVQERDDQGRIVATVGPGGHRWTYDRNRSGDVSAFRTPSGYEWQIRYDRRGQIAGVVDPEGRETSDSWAADGLEHVVADTAGVISRSKYDTFGRLVSYSEGTGPELTVRYEGLTEHVINVDGSRQCREYDQLGNLLQFVDELGAAWRFDYDSYGRLGTRTDPLKFRIALEYDDEGRVSAVVNENGDRLENTRDALGRIITQATFDETKRSYEYDAAGRLIGRTDGCGEHVALECDPMGRPAVRHYFDGLALQDTYDHSGRLVRTDDLHGTLELDYDPEGRQVREAYEGEDVFQEYGWGPHPLSLVNGLTTVRFSYDSRQRLRSVADLEGFAAEFYYDDCAGQTIRIQGGLTIHREFDVRNRIVRQVATSAKGTLLVADRYEYDPAGNLTRRHREGGSTLEFRHNARGELRQVLRDGSRVRSYDYDGTGNIIRADGLDREYKRGDRLVRSPSGMYEHDGEGRPQSRRSGDVVHHYRYDHLGRLAQVLLGDRGPVDFRYDAKFRRREKAFEGQTQRTLWAGDTPLRDDLPDGGSITYIYHPVDQTPLALAIDRCWYYVLVDPRGEVTDLIRADDEMVVWTVEPLGFRSEVRLDFLGLPISLRGPGQQFDRETGLMYQRARYYDPDEGRFFTPDPLGIFGGWNLYRFCLNRPFQLIDPLGLAPAGPCPLSQTECDDLYNDIERRAKHLEKRWNESYNPNDILPWSNAPPKGALYTAAAVAADGTAIPAGTVSKGSVDTHLKAYDDEQRGLGNKLQEYYAGGCAQHEDSTRSQAMEQHGDWALKSMSLPKYGLP
jgi:RHS repeat-associated protein